MVNGWSSIGNMGIHPRIFLRLGNEWRTIPHWAEFYGIKANILYGRYRRGWKVNKDFFRIRIKSNNNKS